MPNPETHGQPEVNQETEQDLRERQRQENLARIAEQFKGINWADYEPASGAENAPLRFFISKTNPNDRLVRIMHPESEYPVVVRIPEPEQSVTAQEMTEYWDDVQSRVMLDESTLTTLAEMASRYNYRQPLILEGPPAVSKTFGTWVFSTIIGQPYNRTSFSAGTRKEDIYGSRTPESKFKLASYFRSVMDSAGIQNRMNIIQRKLDRYAAHNPAEPIDSTLSKEAQREAADAATFDLINDALNEREVDFYTYVQTVRSLIDAGATDEELLPTAVMLEGQTGSKLVVSSEYSWEDTKLTWILEHGGIAALDEPNTADVGQLEILLPALEVKTNSIPAPAARGRNIQRHPDAYIVLAQNPPSVAGRNELSDAFESRCHKLVLPPLTREYVENALRFFMTGRDPDVRINGNVYKGRDNVQTAHRPYLENMPKRDLVIKTIAELHKTIADWVDTKQIGRKRRDGGNFVFDQRDIASLLDSMVASINRDMVQDTPNGLQPVDIDWEHVIKKSLYEVYLSGLPGDETIEGDYKKVFELIDGQVLWNQLKKATAQVSFVEPGTKVKVDTKKKLITPDF